MGIGFQKYPNGLCEGNSISYTLGLYESWGILLRNFGLNKPDLIGDVGVEDVIGVGGLEKNLGC
jgi:hypothetical protein